MMYHRLTVLFFMVLALPISTPAQTSESKAQSGNAYELWRVRAQTITDDVLKDTSHLISLRRAIVRVRLAELWWHDDPRRARTWLTDAIEVVEQVPNRESPQERQQRLATAKFLLRVASPLDQKLSKRLIALTTEVDESTSAEERASIADSLINTAVSMVDRDPKRAAELGSQALRVGTPRDFADLLIALRYREPKMADNLFAQALSAARQKLETPLLNSLSHAAFPTHKGTVGPVPVPPDHLKAELLEVHVAFLNAHVNELRSGRSACFAVGSFILPVLPEFDRLLPQQSLLVRQTVQKCQPFIPTGHAAQDNAAGAQQPNTVDALLQAAADTDNIGVRTLYQFRAAQLAKDQQDYDQAVKILDNMSKESREVMQSSWGIARADWAASSALDHYKNGRLVEMNAVLNAVPTNVQPLARMMFLDRLPAKKDSEGALTTQFLNDARTGLRKSDMPDSEKFSLYFDLHHLTLRYQPTDAISVLKEAIASLNRGITNDAKFLDGTEFTNALPASLLEIDEFALKEILASVTSVEARAQLRLHLLKDTLQRMKP